MIVQGFNSPLVMILKTDISGVTYFHGQLSDAAGTVIKEWGKDDVTIDTNTVIFPLKQSETAAMTDGMVFLTAIWDNDGKAKGGTFPYPVKISRYPDKTVLGDDDTITEYSTVIEAEELPDPYDITGNMIKNALVVKTATVPDSVMESVVEMWLSEHKDEIKGERGERGEKGNTGEQGEDGFSPIANVKKTDSGVVISITDKTGTTAETVITEGGVTVVPASTSGTAVGSVNGVMLYTQTTNNAEGDNTLPITSAGVNTIVGNINVLLSII